jgi:hypothetical protein
MLLNKFLNWSLKMLLAMCCFEISLLLLATGIFVRMFEQQRKERGVKKQLDGTWVEVNNKGMCHIQNS